MFHVQRSILFFIAALFFGQFAFAGLDEAKANYAKIFEVPANSKFENSPFNHTYLLNAGDTHTLFDQNLTISGYQQNWRMREDVKKGFVELNFNQSEGLKTLLLQNLKTDWMVNAVYGTGGKRIIVISAPNCPICKQMEAEMMKYSKDISASIFIVPTLLGRDQASYRNAIMCSQNPNESWQRSWQSSTYPKSSVQCEKSRWAEIVIDNAFPVVNGQIRIGTPAIILPDGSVIKGWTAGGSAADIKRKLVLP